MKILIVFLISFVFSFKTHAQSENDFGKIALSVVMPENIEGLDQSQISKLLSKITQIVTSTGLSASGYNYNFVIYPKFAIYENDIVEGGMQNIYILNIQLELFIKQVDNNLVFSSISKTIKGTGTSKNSAIVNAISKIPISDNELNQFIEIGKTKIIQYYENKCTDLISEANSLIKMEQFENAIGLMMTIPEEVVECHKKAMEIAFNAYNLSKEKECKLILVKAKGEFQKNNFESGIDLISQMDPTTKCYIASQNEIANFKENVCNQLLTKAKTLVAKNKYLEASDYLMQIHSDTKCFLNAQNLVKKIEIKIANAERAEWNYKMQKYKDKLEKQKKEFEFRKEIHNDNVGLEKQRIEAVRQIAVTYYKNQPKKVNYLYIVK